MNIKSCYAGLAGLALIGGLAACGSATQAAPPRAAVTVTATPPPTVTVTPTPTPTKTKTVVVVPAQTVYEPAAPALTNCGGGVYAGANTSCPFALNVAQAYQTDWTPGSAIYAYSPVTGSTYAMSCYGSDPTTCTGGNNALVELYS